MFNARHAREIRAYNRATEKAAKGEKLTKRDRKVIEKVERKAPVFDPFVPR